MDMQQHFQNDAETHERGHKMANIGQAQE